MILNIDWVYEESNLSFMHLALNNEIYILLYISNAILSAKANSPVPKIK